MEGPLNSDGHTLTLKKASETTPAKITCQIICHDANSERQYNPMLRIGVMYENPRAIERVLSINRNHSEPDVYRIHSENTSYCHSGNNETNFVSYVYVYPHSPILLAFCSVTYYDPMSSTLEICHGSSFTVITYEELSSTTATEANSNNIELTTRLDGVSSTTEFGEEVTSTSTTKFNADVTAIPKVDPCSDETLMILVAFLVIVVVIMLLETILLIGIGIKCTMSKGSVNITRVRPMEDELQLL